MKNYYSVLGVRENADQPEIKRAYRNLMRKWHPDVNRMQDATSRTEEVNHAFAVLSCPQSRYNHDIKLKEAGLSSKLLFIKHSNLCKDCRGKGSIKVYSKTKTHRIMKWFGIPTPFEEHMCLPCCGTGTEHRITEF